MNMQSIRALQFPRETVERIARTHRTNKLAGAALGIGGTSFLRLCRHYDITPPHERSDDKTLFNA